MPRAQGQRRGWGRRSLLPEKIWMFDYSRTRTGRTTQLHKPSGNGWPSSPLFARRPGWSRDRYAPDYFEENNGRRQAASLLRPETLCGHVRTSPAR
jgi:hypothetical protein